MSKNSELEIQYLLREGKLRVTKFRKLVLGVLLQSGETALSSHDIEAKLPSMDRITLYRTLKSLEGAGIIHSVSDGSGKSKYACCSHDCLNGKHYDNHVHFHCRICDTTSCLDHIILPEISLPAHYKSEEVKFVVAGICANCGTVE